MTLIKNKIKKYVINYLPAPFANYSRLGKKVWRRFKYRFWQKIHPVNISKNDLVKAFSEIGIDKGSKVCVYSAMSSFGHIEGGANTVITALEEVVGEEGLIAMPAFPIVGNAIEYLERGLVFDALETPSNMGAITEYFRCMHNVLRSVHPTHSICAKGNGASQLIEGHGDCLTPFNQNSPFMKMIDQNMDMICFGVGVHVFTLYHTFEDICGDRFPLCVYLNRHFEVLCIESDGSKRTVLTTVHDPSVSIRRIDCNPKKEDEILHLLQDSGKLRSTRVGKGEMLAIKARDLMSELKRFLEMGITIYV